MGEEIESESGRRERKQRMVMKGRRGRKEMDNR